MKKDIIILGIILSSLLGHSQIYEETRYQLMLNHKFKEKNTISFQPEMRVKYFIENITITLWRLVYIRQVNEKANWSIGANWFNNWSNYDVTEHELRAHIESSFKDKYGKWDYSNRYRLDYRNYYTSQWRYEGSVFRMRYLISWSRDLLHNDKGQKLTLYLADEVFLNVAGTSHFNIYDQNRLGGFLIYKLNEKMQIRSTYWWEYRGKNKYNHQFWFQIGYDI
ncbi:MAG: DUF2490 domain-containing protein [Bacteroidetes bacterium]|jgi:hypothetical protein|nr:MAG: DUF2490 domain-containing protein [Bacteroidota bacterium]